MFMEQLDGTVIATALPQMAGSFSVTAVDLNIGMSAYLLTLAVFIPASGWMADKLGGRTVFCLGHRHVHACLCSLRVEPGAVVIHCRPHPAGRGGAMGALTVGHMMRTAHPLLDLQPFKLPTFMIAVRGGITFRAAIAALPFLLPLLFQLVFGLDPFASGLLLLALFADNLGRKAATSSVLNRFGFRTTLMVNGAVAIATMIGCSLLTPDTPTAVIVPLLFISGLARSMQFTTLNTLAFAEVQQAHMSGANTLFSMMNQMGSGLGIAVGAVSLRAGGLLHSMTEAVSGRDFRIAFAVVAALAMAAYLDFHRLSPDAADALRKRRR
jgi:MFS family permease